MKTNSHKEQEQQNLVMFPASKNYKIDLGDRVYSKDPLHEILDEYSQLKEEDIPSYLDDRFELDKNEVFLDLEDHAFDSLDAFMNRHQRGKILTPDDKHIKHINERLAAIKEAKERIKFYLDEIEMFLPAKRK